jgi:hypothetical protein
MAAIDVLLGLIPLHSKMEAKAQAGTYTQQWKPRSIRHGQVKKGQDMIKEPILQMGTDKFIPRYAFHNIHS